MQIPQQWQIDLKASVKTALSEDVGDGDITAELIPANQHMKARVITREKATIAGVAWVNEVFVQLDPSVQITWHCQDGQEVKENETLFELEGSARSLLTGERAALNFLQLLSGVATTCKTLCKISLMVLA